MPSTAARPIPARKPPIGVTEGGEFHIYNPDPIAAREEQPGQDWAGGELRFIESNSHVPMEPLQPSLERLLQNIWKEARPNTAAPHRFLAGQQRMPIPQVTIGRQRIAPIPGPAYQKIPALITPTDNKAHLIGVAKDWAGMLTINRVVAYCFRGDTRDSNQIKTAGGFFPNSSRNDKDYLEGEVFNQFHAYMLRRFNLDIDKDLYVQAIKKSMDANAIKLFMEYSTWRALVSTEEMHLGRMLASEALKGYTSTTRAVTTAKKFATRGLKCPGYVYSLLVRGGYLVPPQGKMAWTLYNEQEVAYPGPIPWLDVVGFRHVQANGMFDGHIYLRTGLYKTDYQAADQIFALLSGKMQS